MQEQQGRWERRPVIAALLRATILLVPVALGVLAGVLVSTLLGTPEGVGRTVAFVAVVLAATTLAVVLAERLLRRLAPLALLLRMGMVFSDAAPRRFRVALRAARPARLAAELRADGDDASPEVALGLLAALLAHDRGTRGHSERTAAFTAMLAEGMGLPEDEVIRAEWGGLLHDVGKLEVPGSLLRKRGGLDDDEWRTMREHPRFGRELVAPLRAWLGDGVAAVDGHHERWDGRGYPDGLVGEQIPRAARIVAVADAFETMTAARSYKDPIARQQARTELAACAGGQFDPGVVRAFLGLSIPKLWLVAGPLAALVQVPLLGSFLRGTVLVPDLPAAASSVVSSVGQVATGAAVAGTAVVVTTVAMPGTAATAPEPAEAPAAVGAPAPVEDAEPSGAPASSPSTTTPMPSPDELVAAGVFAAAVEAAEAEAEADAGAPSGPGGGAEDSSSPTATPAPAPGSSGSAPGQQPGANPGHGGTPPGHGGTPPGQVPGSNPGHGGTPPGQVEGGNPGHGGTPPGQG